MLGTRPVSYTHLRAHETTKKHRPLAGARHIHCDGDAQTKRLRLPLQLLRHYALEKFRGGHGSTPPGFWMKPLEKK